MKTTHGDNWWMYNGDCCEVMRDLDNESVGYSVFSPPFSSLYVYSDSDRDMGNCSSHDEFFEHFGFMTYHLHRILQPGRNVSIHCMNLPTSKARDGVIGLYDFRGEIIRHMVKQGFIYHSEVCIWKDPVTAMQRTKALGLLHKQLLKDSCMSRQGVPDYVCTFRKPGVNPKPVDGPLDHFAGDMTTFRSTGNLSIDIWQRYASPVWMDINQTRTLNKDGARDDKDERHICPLQLDVIERCLQLWSKDGDIVFSPFAGIGSEGYMSLKLGRKFVGIELKQSYFEHACANLAAAEAESLPLFTAI